MRVAEKTLELSLCTQLTPLFFRGYWPLPYLGMPQPIWFGLTQAQEAKAGFDAATRLGSGRLLLLQFKAGRKLQNGKVRFSASHAQLTALQKRLSGMARLIYYVLPEVTRTTDLYSQPWLVARTWFLDVASIPALGAPARRSNNHHMTLDPATGDVLITSDPVTVRAINATEITERLGRSSLGAHFESHEKFWSYAKLLGHNSVGAALPERA